MLLVSDEYKSAFRFYVSELLIFPVLISIIDPENC
jgi:hypothetical protein